VPPCHDKSDANPSRNVTATPTLADVTNKDNVEDALAAAVTNAALEGIHVAEDEQTLIRLHQSGAIDKAEFLRRAADLAQRKADGGGP
jgi:hypothetical protein